MGKMIDTHAHLNDEIFDDSIKSIIENFSEDNLMQVYVVGCDENSSKKAIELADSYRDIFAIIGLHPSYSNLWDNNFENFLLTSATHKKVIAVGEIGLDYHYKNTDKLKQRQVFISQLQIANKLNLPVVIHVRDAIDDLINILKEHRHLLMCGGVIHCFNESVQSYKELKELGFKFSFGGAITFKNNKNATELLANVDVNDILLETDCPYLTPEPLRGREKNQPKYVKYVVEKIAEIKQINVDKLIDITTQNTLKVFKKVEKLNEY